MVEAVIAFILADALVEKLGGDSLGEMMPRFKALCKNLSNLPMDNFGHVFWPEENGPLDTNRSDKA